MTAQGPGEPTKPPLSALTTLRVGGAADSLVIAETEAELIDAVATADAAGQPATVLGGGSNVVVADAGLPGTVVVVRTRGIEVTTDACSGAWVRVAAGEPWDDLVARAVSEGWSGLEALSGIPGLTGGTPIQNVGAYGQEVADTIARVTVYDRVARRLAVLASGDCGFGYRSSHFKSDPSRYVVVSVEFQLRLGDLSAPVGYAELADRLGVAVGERAPAPEVRAAVLELRRGKGMVLDAADHDTWSVGSFFTNPVVPANAVPEGAPAWPADAPDTDADDPRLVKTSAAWLVERAGFPRGYPEGGAARLSTKHTLAITNRGDATASDVIALARTIRDGVRDRFGISLVPEPVLLGCTLD
ncbi:MAG: UDP-N-acetylmuramate dehydrogenase [Candidatus Nanopelagicales bacterium]